MPTQLQIDTLKAQWRGDPCWDLEHTEGFEEHKDELLTYRYAKEREWEQARHEKIVAKAEKLGIPDHLELAEYLISLENRLVRLENATSGDF